jgi:hypothetical protein
MHSECLTKASFLTNGGSYGFAILQKHLSKISYSFVNLMNDLNRDLWTARMTQCKAAALSECRGSSAGNSRQKQRFLKILLFHKIFFEQRPECVLFGYIGLFGAL